MSIFASSGMDLAHGSEADPGEMESLGAGFQDEEFAEDLQAAPPEEEADFDLDLSDAKTSSDPGVAETAAVETAPEMPDSPPVEEPTEIQFDVETATDDLDEVQVEDMGFDFDAESVDLAAPAVDSGEEEGIELSLDEPQEIEANFDLDAFDEPAPSEPDAEPDAEPAMDLDTELSFETDDDALSMDTDLSLEEDSESSLDIDMDLDLDPPAK